MVTPPSPGDGPPATTALRRGRPSGVLAKAARSSFAPMALGAGLLIAAGPVLRHSYLLFHSLTEIGVATIAFATFLFAWNTRRYLGPFLLSIGTASLFVGLFETLHCLAFPGMQVFVGYDSNLSPQLWLAARTTEAASLALGLALSSRAAKARWLLLGFGAAFAAGCAAIFGRLVPPMVIPSGGLTPLKVAVEWVLAVAFLGSAAVLLRQRNRFPPRVLRYLVTNAGAMAACEICFTLYSKPYDASNFLGHVLLLCGVYWQFKAVLQTGLTDPNEAQFREMVRVQGALREADRRKDEFLAVLSHELRNPLAPIRNSLYVLGRAAPGGEKARKAQAVIERQVDQLSRLVDDLLDVTRITQGKIRLQKEAVALDSLVGRTAEDHRGSFSRAGVDLRVDVRGGSLWAEADPTRIAQAIGNLLGNAAKFTSRGGSTSLSLEREGKLAVIRVRDDGAGIAPEVLPHLFAPFVQAESTLDRSRGGLGLGLALVKGLVELHGGSVAASSGGPGKGSEFTIRLPLGSPPAAQPPPASAPAASRRVLIIEDNCDAAESLKEVLEVCGHTVEVALFGQDGIEKARSFGPDAVVCDIGLPKMNGYEVARAIRSDPALGVPLLVALSGYAQEEDVARSREAGFDHHLAKPPDLDALQRMLAEGPARRRAG